MLGRDFMTELEETSLKTAISEELERRINRTAQRISTIEEAGKTKKLSPLDLLDLKRYKDDAHKLQELRQAFFNFRFNRVKSVSLPQDIKDKLESIGSNLAENEASLLRISVQSSVRNANSTNRNEITESAQKIQNLIEKNKLTKCVLYYNRMQVSLSLGIQQLEHLALSRISAEPVSLDFSKKVQSQLPSSEDRMLDSIQEMIQSKSLVPDQNVQSIIKNISMIRAMFQERQRAMSMNSKITVLITQLDSSAIDFSKTQDLLQKLYNANNRSISKCDAYLSKFDFEACKKVVREQEEKKNEQTRRDSVINEYSALAYKLQEAESENKDYDEIRKIQDQMVLVANEAVRLGVSSSELQTALDTGREKYKNEKYNREILAKARREETEQLRQMNNELVAALREKAIRQLELEGAFEGSYEWRNGDAYSTIDSEQMESMIQKRMRELSSELDKDQSLEATDAEIRKYNQIIQEEQSNLRDSAVAALKQDGVMLYGDEGEAAIQKKMAEMVSYASMTPEQRGLESLKRGGHVEESATLADLRGQQLADFRYAYRDTEEDRMIRESQRKVSAQRQEKANTIYKQYIRYLATVEDKTTALKFSEYSQIVYGQSDIDISMVDEEVKGKSI